MKTKIVFGCLFALLAVVQAQAQTDPTLGWNDCRLYRQGERPAQGTGENHDDADYRSSVDSGGSGSDYRPATTVQ